MARAAAVALIVLVGCGGSPPATPEPTPTPEPLPTLSGQLILYNGETVRMEPSSPRPGDPITSCRGTGGYSDIQTGMSLTIRDGSGATLATTRLGHEGVTFTLVEHEDRMIAQMISGWRCQYTFSTEVPEAEFYALDLGRRGELTYSRDELEEMGWSVTLTIGR